MLERRVDATSIWSWLMEPRDGRCHGSQYASYLMVKHHPSRRVNIAPEASTPRSRDFRTAAVRTNSESTTELSMQSIYEQRSFDPQDYRRWTFVACCQAPKD